MTFRLLTFPFPQMPSATRKRSTKCAKFSTSSTRTGRHRLRAARGARRALLGRWFPGGGAQVGRAANAHLFLFPSDGTITISELGIVLKSLKKNFNEKQLKEIINKVDKNGDGQIDFEEFLKMMSDRVASRNRDFELKEAFNVFDQDSDGYITSVELSTVMRTLGEQIDKETIDLMIEGVDRDDDGEIDFNEFKMMMAEGPQ